MLRTLAKASSVFRRLAAASTTRHKLLNPAIFPAVAAVPYHTNLANHLSQTSPLFFPALLGQFRGYAPAPGRRVPDRRVPEDDDDLSDGDMDSEDFEIGGEDFPEDDDEGITDEDYLDEDEVEDESD
ncbi:hypothetical protein IEQ34_022228 [Dendrobium chrysotoxum]|uniref:Uncharacterized protein n=1 Tax=Dendrobium chrysotoxum TaxID=161865 RepID=A0AAV7FYG5_DENCH|nr:hypothetical protein IEQ34_022228 [Dendrobium chrysotoxum]